MNIDAARQKFGLTSTDLDVISGAVAGYTIKETVDYSPRTDKPIAASI